jgi:putative membrane protein
MALDIHLIHFLEHALFFSTAFLMWIPLLSPFKQISILAPPLKMMYLFFLSVGQIIVFGPITFSEVVLYSGYLNSPVTVITPLQDQIIGGIFMKISGGFIFLTLFIITFFCIGKLY